MVKRSVEPLLWTLFSAGGVLAALFLPSLVFLFGVAFPLGWLSPPRHEHLLAALRLALLVGELEALGLVAALHLLHGLTGRTLALVLVGHLLQFGRHSLA